MRRLPILLAALLLPSLALADEPTPERLVLRPAHVLDITAGVLLSERAVVVEGDRIAAIVPVGEAPKDVRAVDLPGLTLLPGLIDAHTHLLYDPDWMKPRLGYQPSTAAAERALVGARNAGRTLRAGFTTVRDLGSCCFADITLSRAVDEGLIEGPEILPAGYAITSTGGDCDYTVSESTVHDGGPQQGIADGPESLRRAARYQMRAGAKVIKVCADRGSFEYEELRILVDTARRRDIPVAVHVWETETVRAAVEAGVASIEHIAVLDDALIDAMIEHGTFLVPTVHVIDAPLPPQVPDKMRERLEREKPLYWEWLRKAVERGVRIALGSDAGEFHHGENAKEFAGLVRRGGMTPLQALRAATTDAAELLGLDDRGRIAEGLRADLVAVEGNPLDGVEVLEDVRWVMKGGVVYKPASPTAAGE